MQVRRPPRLRRRRTAGHGPGLLVGGAGLVVGVLGGWLAGLLRGPRTPS